MFSEKKLSVDPELGLFNIYAVERRAKPLCIIQMSIKSPGKTKCQSIVCKKALLLPITGISRNKSENPRCCQAFLPKLTKKTFVYSHL